MSWKSASEIFDPVCTLIVDLREGAEVTDERITKVLAGVIATLQDNDWDGEVNSLLDFTEYPYVVEAFKRQGVELEEDE